MIHYQNLFWGLKPYFKTLTLVYKTDFSRKSDFGFFGPFPAFIHLQTFNLPTIPDKATPPGT